jgi:hypothetical protein
MKIHNVIQKSPEWHALRAEHFTASELGPWVLEPVKINLTIDQIKGELDRIGITRKGLTKRDELLDMLTKCSALNYEELCEGARTAIFSKLKQERVAKMMASDPYELSPEESIYLEREMELAAKRERDFAYNIPVKYGNMLEPSARVAYESMTGYEVQEVGFVSQDGFGCSPDGLFPDYGDLRHADVVFEKYKHGVEIKCPVPETHLAWLWEHEKTGQMPECHKLQVHASMVCCEVSRWDFFSYCPGDVPLHVVVERDEFTDQLESGLRKLVAEKKRIKAWLAAMWKGRES